MFFSKLQHPFFRLFRRYEKRDDQFRHLFCVHQFLADQFAAAEITGSGSFPCGNGHLGAAGRTGMLFQILSCGTGFVVPFFQFAPLRHIFLYFFNTGNLAAVGTAVSLADNIKACRRAAVFTENPKRIVFSHVSCPP